MDKIIFEMAGAAIVQLIDSLNQRRAGKPRATEQPKKKTYNFEEKPPASMIDLIINPDPPRDCNNCMYYEPDRFFMKSEYLDIAKAHEYAKCTNPDILYARPYRTLRHVHCSTARSYECKDLQHHAPKQILGSSTIIFNDVAIRIYNRELYSWA